jgi:hypothetical protein
MKFSEYNYLHVIIGVVAASLPFIALGFKFGAAKGFITLLLFVTALLLAKLTIYLFTRRGKLLKGAAIALEGNLVFLFFLPKHIKQQLKTLREREDLTSYSKN